MLRVETSEKFQRRRARISGQLNLRVEALERVTLCCKNI